MSSPDSSPEASLDSFLSGVDNTQSEKDVDEVDTLALTTTFVIIEDYLAKKDEVVSSSSSSSSSISSSDKTELDKRRKDQDQERGERVTSNVEKTINESNINNTHINNTHKSTQRSGILNKTDDHHQNNQNTNNTNNNNGKSTADGSILSTGNTSGTSGTSNSTSGTNTLSSNSLDAYLKSFNSNKNNNQTKVEKPAPEGTFKYTVLPNDSLVSIAVKFNLTVSEITAVNKLSSRVLFPGQTIFIPVKSFILPSISSTATAVGNSTLPLNSHSATSATSAISSLTSIASTLPPLSTASTSSLSSSTVTSTSTSASLSSTPTPSSSSSSSSVLPTTMPPSLVALSRLHTLPSSSYSLAKAELSDQIFTPPASEGGLFMSSASRSSVTSTLISIQQQQALAKRSKSGSDPVSPTFAASLQISVNLDEFFELTPTACSVSTKLFILSRGIVNGILTISQEEFIFAPDDDDVLVQQRGVDPFSIHCSLKKLIEYKIDDELPTGFHLSSSKLKNLAQAPFTFLQVCLEGGAAAFPTDTNQEGKAPYCFAISKSRIDNVLACLIGWASHIALESDSKDNEGSWETDMSEESEETPHPTALSSSVVDLSFLQQARILNEELVMNIIHALPFRVRDSGWEINYSTFLHGISLKTFFRNQTKIEGGVVLVVEDIDGNIFGAYCTEPFRITESFYGSGECFLFKATPTFSVYRWDGTNDYFMFGSYDSIMMGGGDGLFGLWLDDNFHHGSSNHCLTFENPPLAGKIDFLIKGVEAWALY